MMICNYCIYIVHKLTYGCTCKVSHRLVHKVLTNIDNKTTSLNILLLFYLIIYVQMRNLTSIGQDSCMSGWALINQLIDGNS